MSYIVATDGSEESKNAITYAVEHAVAFEKRLEIVHVLTPNTDIVDETLVMQDQDTATDAGHEILEAATDLATETASSNLEVETQLLAGRPAPAIADRARAIDADAIFVGHRGLSGKEEAMVGSVAKQVVSRASVPVTVVR